jgi:hypothetical protein
MPVVNLVLEACRDLAGACNRSTQIREQLTANQLATNEPVKTLKQSVVTRWNSLLHNIKSTLDSEKAIISFCVANSKHGFSGVILLHGDLFWSLLKCLRILLEAFETAAKDMSAEGIITADRIVANYLGLREMLANPTLFLTTDDPTDLLNCAMDEAIQISLRCATIMARHLDQKFEPLQPAEIMAFALNPLFQLIIRPTNEHDEKWNEFLMQERLLLASLGRTKQQTTGPTLPTGEALLPGSIYRNKVNKGLQSEMNVNQKVNDAALHAELNQFKQEKGFNTPFDLAGWWRNHAVRYPRLSKLALRFLSIPASQTAS